MLRRLDLRRNVQDKSVSTKPDDESSLPATMGGEPGSAWGDETSAQYQALVSYMPHFRRAAFDPRTKRSFPSAASASAAVLRCDIVGFTLLTDRMVKSGIAGAEQLADVMNQVINRTAEIAWTGGGDASEHISSNFSPHHCRTCLVSGAPPSFSRNRPLWSAARQGIDVH